MHARISRKTNQINPRFFDFPEPGGGPSWPGRYSAGADSGVFVRVVIQTAYCKASTISL
jgi:hypothetical protein